MKIFHARLYKLLINNWLVRKILHLKFERKFVSSAIYWETRYANNGTSGNGSYGKIAMYKAGILNNFVKEHEIKTVLEIGSGDGNQLQLLDFPSYIGLDVSQTAVEKCRHVFKGDVNKKFFVYNSDGIDNLSPVFEAELVLSLDVIYHLFEDQVYENYMRDLFSFSRKFVIIYAWDVEGQKILHVKHRKFSEWISRNKKDWHLIKKIENNAAPTCDFFIYEKIILPYKTGG